MVPSLREGDQLRSSLTSGLCMLTAVKFNKTTMMNRRKCLAAAQHVLATSRALRSCNMTLSAYHAYMILSSIVLD